MKYKVGNRVRLLSKQEYGALYPNKLFTFKNWIENHNLFNKIVTITNNANCYEHSGDPGNIFRWDECDVKSCTVQSLMDLLND